MRRLIIGIVGPCASGKTTLAARLSALGYDTHHIAQEHSYVPYMWKRITNPDILIYLQVSYPNTIIRRNMNWTEAEYDQQLFRLRHAREHADLTVNTDQLSADEVAARVLEYIRQHE